MRSLIFLIITFFVTSPAFALSGDLVIYTYSSFTSEWGPGPLVTERFEKSCACKIEWVTADDGGALLSRLRLEGSNTRADIVLGLDNNLAATAKKLGIFTAHGLKGELSLPIVWQDDTFLPFDYGFFAFMYDTQLLPNPPHSMRQLIDMEDTTKILLEDPRSSAPGLGLLLWVKALYGADAPDVWRKLKGKVLTVSKGWSEAYGLFLKGEAPMVLSYTTSQAYHQAIEKTDRYKAAIFDEGHYVQVEAAAKTTKGSLNPLADVFLKFVVSEGFQSAIPQGNWMYPVKGHDRLPDVFKQLPIPPNSFVLESDDIDAHRKEWLAEWLDVMAR